MVERRPVTAFIDTTQVKKDMAYSLADLSTAMMQQASLFAHYGVLLAQASRQVDDIELLLDVARSKVTRRLRDDYAKAGEKVAATLIDKEVETDDKIVSLRIALNEAKQIENIARTVVDGFKQRRDMLIQHGSTEREERKGELAIKARRAVQEDVSAMGSRVAARLASTGG